MFLHLYNAMYAVLVGSMLATKRVATALRDSKLTSKA